MSHTYDHTTCQSCNQRFNSVFCKAQEDYVNMINEQKVCNTYKKGQTLFNEGSNPFGVFCINNGKVKLSHQGDDGKEQIVRLLKQGDVIGYRALLSGKDTVPVPLPLKIHRSVSSLKTCLSMY